MGKNGFSKLIQLGELSSEGEPTIRIVRPGDLNVPWVKCASEAMDYIKHVEPVKGKTIILILAVSAYEFYGGNNNGDGWTERPMTIGSTRITEDDVLPKHYKSFETDGNVFKHHVNKDPLKKIGDILKAFYNDSMHRVELLLELDNEKAEDFVQRIEKGEFIPGSMGCFPAGTMITMADGTRKPIEEIKVGDIVLTHKGRAKKATKLHRRHYTGKLHKIRALAHETVSVTSEHPFLAIQRKDVVKDKSGVFRWAEKPVLNPDWTHARCLQFTKHAKDKKTQLRRRDDNLLLEPIIDDVVTPGYVERPFARLFGYYLAEGHILRNREERIIGIELTVNKDDYILTEIEDLCTAFDTKNKPVINPRRNSPAARSIMIIDRYLGELCYEHAGSYSKKKCLSYGAMRWHPDMQLEMVGTYANGDGFSVRNDALGLSTASPNLAWQLVAILHRLGIAPSINTIEHKAGTGFNRHSTYEWVIHIGKADARKLENVCAKVHPSALKGRRSERQIVDDYVISPILDYDIKHVKNLPVFNFEVEDDESYVAAGHAVHNCRIKFDVCVVCGNKARNRSEYCDHAKFNLGNYLPNGKRVIVLNPSPRFFDFSLIRKPAERIAYMIKKVADVIEVVSSAEMGERIENLQTKSAAFKKLSLIKKVMEGQAVAAKDDDGEITRLNSFKDHIAIPATKETPALGDETIRELIKYRPAEVLSTLSSMGIIMTTPEFLKFFVWKAVPDVEIPIDALNRAVALQGEIFDLLAEKPEIAAEMEETGFLDITPENINESLVEKFRPLLEKRSQVGQYLYRHLVPDIFKKTTGHGHWDPINVTDPRTGVPYQTTRRALTKAQDHAGKKQLTGLLGGGALMAGGLKMLTLPFLKYLAPFAAVPGGLMFAKGMQGPQGAHSASGQFVPRGTELGIKRGELDESRAMLDLAQDLAVSKQASIRAGIKGDSFDAIAHQIGEVILGM